MAFKFKVKKRPNLAQAVTSAFTQGAIRGGQAALQQMIKDREANEKKEKELQKSLRTKRQDVQQLINLTDDEDKKKSLRLIAVKASQYPSVEAIDEDVSETGIFDEPGMTTIGQEQFGRFVKQPEFPIKKYEIGETRQVLSGSDTITQEYSFDPTTKQPVWKEIARAPRTTTKAKKYQAYNTETGEEIRATEEEVENDPNIMFGTKKFPATKKVENKSTGELEFASEQQIAKSKGNLIPVKNQPSYLIDFLSDDSDQTTGTPQETTITPITSPKRISLPDATSGKIKLSVGDTIFDPILGEFIYNGGDQSKPDSYDAVIEN